VLKYANGYGPKNEEAYFSTIWFSIGSEDGLLWWWWWTLLYHSTLIHS